MFKSGPRGPTLDVDIPTTPPAWALLERELIRAQTLACQEFFDHYFDDRGYLLCVPRWGADDGADDAAENFLNWTMLHALGAPDVVLDMYSKAWEGHLRQYTEAKTVEVPFARDGMYYREFPVMFDWFHNGEGLSAFILEGLSNPQGRAYLDRSKRYAGLYMNEDPLAPNYDPEHRIIRSMFNGSRGPLLRKATAVDWIGDPIEIEGRFKPKHGERSYQEMLDHYKNYNNIVGDHPLNLGATTLAFNAYALSGESKYRDWLLQYVDAWVERTEANGGIIPTNIGLDGVIGGAWDGKWYGGIWGWSHTITVPQTGELKHIPAFLGRSHYGFANALLLTGEQRYVDLWRGMQDRVNANCREIDGQTMYPHMHGDQGWYHYTPEKFLDGALELYYWSMDREDLNRLHDTRWISFLEGNDPNYPVDALQQDFAVLRQKVDEMRRDSTTPDTRMSDDPNHINPATTLTQLMLGGLPTGSVGGPLHCRLLYFDPVRRRTGIPEDVGALVEKMTDDEVTVVLVNISQVDERTVVVQGGAYAEHQLISVAVEDRVHPIGHPFLSVRLAPGSGARLVLRTKRYANQPTLAFPWV